MADQVELTIELGLLERLDLADVHILHGVDALHSLEDFSGDVLGDAAARDEKQRRNVKSVKNANSLENLKEIQTTQLYFRFRNALQQKSHAPTDPSQITSFLIESIEQQNEVNGTSSSRPLQY